MALLLTETSKTDRGLSSLVMLLWQLDSEFVLDLASIALKSSVEGSSSIDYDESEGWLTDQQVLFEVLKMELGITVIDGEIDGLEWLEITDEFLFRGGVIIHDLTD